MALGQREAFSKVRTLGFIISLSMVTWEIFTFLFFFILMAYSYLEIPTKS